MTYVYKYSASPMVISVQDYFVDFWYSLEWIAHAVGPAVDRWMVLRIYGNTPTLY